MRSFATPTLTKQFLRLALPVVLIQGGMMSMVLVDTLFVARLGPLAVAGVGLGSTLAISIHLFCTGTLTALEYYSARAVGENDAAKSWFWYWQASYLAIGLGGGAFLSTLVLRGLLPWFGISTELVASTCSFLLPLGLSFFPMFMFFTARQYLASHHRLRFSTATIVLGNGANFLFNAAFIEGRWGAPALGVAGSGLATLLTRGGMASALILYIGYITKSPRIIRLDVMALKALCRLGIPTGSQMLARSLAFSVVGILVAKLGPAAMAAHTISLNLGGFFYMIPMGMGTAGCLLVANALGQGDRDRAFQVGKIAIRVTTAIMVAVGLILFAKRNFLMQSFTVDPAVIELGSAIMILVAVLQLFDGYQMAVIGTLRGFGDSKAALSSNVLGLWMVGLPSALLFGFVFEYGLVGLWVGLIFGLLTSSLLLLYRWRRVFSIEVKGSL